MKIKSITKSVLKGLTKSIPLVGGIASELTESSLEATEHAPKGKIDYPRIIGYVLGGVIIVSFLLGAIEKEDVKFLFNQLIKFEFIY